MDSPDRRKVMLRTSIFIRAQPPIQRRSRASSTFSETIIITKPRLSAALLRRSSLYDSTALPIHLTETQRSFSRYSLDRSWCMSRLHTSRFLTASDKVATNYTPTAYALTIERAIDITRKSPSLSALTYAQALQMRRLLTAPAARASLSPQEWDAQPKMESLATRIHALSITTTTGSSQNQVNTSLPRLFNANDVPGVSTTVRPDLIDIIRTKYNRAIDLSVTRYDRRSHGPNGVQISVRKSRKLYSVGEEELCVNWNVQYARVGSSRTSLRNAYAKLEKELCVIERVQVQLQFLWTINPYTPHHPLLHLTDVRSTSIEMELSAYHKERLSSMRRVLPYQDTLLTDITSFEFCGRLPMDVAEFSAHLASQAASSIESLRSGWLSEAHVLLNFSCIGVPIFEQNVKRKQHYEEMCARQLFQGNKLDYKTCGYGHIAEHASSERSGWNTVPAWDAAYVLLSRQLRYLCEKSLLSFSSFFCAFEGRHSSSMPVFRLLLKLKHLRTHKDAKLGLQMVVVDAVEIIGLEPSLKDLVAHADSAIDGLVLAARQLPLPDIASYKHVAKRSLRSCGIALDDELVLQTRTCVRAALGRYFEEPMKVAAQFNSFQSLVDGSVDNDVRASVDSRARCGADTPYSLDRLVHLCERLAALGKSIRTGTTDVVHAPLFSIVCGECKMRLLSITDTLRLLVAESVASDNHKHMTLICREYSSVIERLQEEPTNCNELRALQEYSTRCVDTLTRLVDEYASQVQDRLQFLLAQTQRDCSRLSMSQQDAVLLVATCHWPVAVRQTMAHSHDVQQARKRQLEMLIEGQQETLSREASSMEKRIEKIAESGSLTPQDVQAVFKRILGAQELLATMRADATDIERQETLLQLALTDNQSRLRTVDTALAPLAKLWSIVKEWVEKINHWQHDPLDKIDAQDAEKSTIELRAALVGAVRELEECGDARATPTRAGKLLQQEVKIFDEEQLPLLRLVCQPGMKDRHWAQIKKSTRLESLEITETSNLLQMLDIGLQHYAGVIEETCVAAGHEHALEMQLQLMESMWTKITFSVEPWRNFLRLSGTEEVQQVRAFIGTLTVIVLFFQELDTQILLTQTVRGNKYIRPHSKRAELWASKLINLQEVVENLRRFEASWLNLEPIFKTADNTLNQMSTEMKLFDELDLTWHEVILAIQRQPTILAVSECSDTLTSLVQANSKIESIQKGLAGYLDVKRQSFPRFNFISDAELLKVIADASDPRCIQAHLHRLFEGLAGLVFTRNADGELQIVAALDVNPKLVEVVESQDVHVDPNKVAYERLNLAYTSLNLSPIRPSISNCDVERWLSEVETTSRKSLAFYIQDSIKTYFGAAATNTFCLRIRRATVWHEQVHIVVCQVAWTSDVENALRRAATATAEVEEAMLLHAQRVPTDSQRREAAVDPHAALRLLHSFKQTQLEETIDTIRGGAAGGIYMGRAQSSLGVLIIVDIYHRDVICALMDSHVCDNAEFEWIVQLRYYLNASDAQVYSKETSVVETCCMQNCLPYAYEYLGGGGKTRIVFTPLTLRCFRAIYCALRVHAGCSLWGFSGSGLTSTLHGLAKALASQLITFNCTASVNCTSIGALIRGSTASQTWLCLDRFSRLRPEIKSVTVMHINDAFANVRKRIQSYPKKTCKGASIGNALRAFLVESGSCATDPSALEYQRRLFRPVSVSCPSQTTIGATLLMSYGACCNHAHNWARQISMVLHLCAESCSGQDGHCQFDLRLSCKTACNLASMLHNLPGYDSEVAASSSSDDSLAIRALCELIEPSLARWDKDIFRMALKAVFSDSYIFQRDSCYGGLLMAFREACPNLNQQPLDSFGTMVVQVYNALSFWSGIALIGDPFSGKSSIWKNVQVTIDKLHSRPVVSRTIQIGALTLHEIYGTYNSEECKWIDGIFPHCIREMSEQETCAANPPKRLFLVLDGNIDASWAEHLHTALDQSCVLCLGNGEILDCSSRLSIIFESETIKLAAPATVGRISVVTCSKSYMQWRVLFEAWTAQHTQKSTEPTKQREPSKSLHQADEGGQNKFALSREETCLLQALAEWLLEPSLVFVRQNLDMVFELITDESLVQSLLRLLDGMLHICLRGVAPGEGSSDVKERRQRRQHIECAFIWSILWSIGASGPNTLQTRYGVFVRGVIADAQIIQEKYPRVHETLATRDWSVPEFTGIFSGTLQLALPTKGFAHDYEYRPRDGETGMWKLWQDALQTGQYAAPDIGVDTTLSELLVPTAQTVQYNLLLDLLRAGSHPALLCGPPGSSKTVHAQAALVRLSPRNYRTAYLRLHSTSSARSLSEALRGCLVRRRKGVHGPPINQRAIIFVDDINLPETCGFGDTQMPSELLRGLIEFKSWHGSLQEECDSRKLWAFGQKMFSTPSLQYIEDTSIWAATNGRAKVTTNSRLLSHFTLIHTSQPGDSTLNRVCTSLVESHFGSQSFTSEIVAASAGVVTATLWILQEVMVKLRPTPARQLCLFDPRDAVNCIQGVLRCHADDEFDRPGLARLWAHEALRTFSDRLDSTCDQNLFLDHLESAILRNFKLDLDSLISNDNSATRNEQQTLRKSTIQIVSENVHELQNLIFGDFHNPLERNVYLEARDMRLVCKSLEEIQDELCCSDPKNVPEIDSQVTSTIGSERKRLMLFPIVVAHISRLVRALGVMRGHILIFGKNRTGKRSVLRLAAHTAGCELREPSSCFFSYSSWRTEVKDALRHAGTGGESPVCMLITDEHLYSTERILADLSDIASTGSTPGLYTADEMSEIIEQTRIRMRCQRGVKHAETMTRSDIFNEFLERARSRLHVALVLSLGSHPEAKRRFGKLIQKFPFVLSHFMCIDHYGPWQGGSLTAFAECCLSVDMLNQYSLLELEPSKQSEIIDSKDRPATEILPGKTFRAALITLCREIHSSIQCQDGADTSTSTYVELLEYLKTNLRQAWSAVITMQTRYGRALDVTQHAQRAITTIGDEITAARAVLEATHIEASTFDSELSYKNSISDVESKRTEVEADAEALLHEEAAAQMLADEFGRDISHAQPAFDEAYFAFESLASEDLVELRSLPRPPIAAKPILEAVCILLGEKPIKVADASDPTRRVLDYWIAAQQRVLMDHPAKLSLKLRAVDQDKIPVKTITKLNEAYIGPGAPHEAAFSDPDILYGFIGASVTRALCRWVCAAGHYHSILLTAQPKRDAAAKAKADVEKSLALLERKHKELNDVETGLASIAALRDSARKRCDALQKIIFDNSHRLERAESLVDTLAAGGELSRWHTSADEANTRKRSLIADALLSACALTYLPQLDSVSRKTKLAEWARLCQDHDLRVSGEWHASQGLSEAHEKSTLPALAIANILGEVGLPNWWEAISPIPWCPRSIVSVSTEYVIESALFAKYARRWPLLLDPHRVAIKWVIAAEARLTIIDRTCAGSKVSSTLVAAAPLGTSVIVENLREEDLSDKAILHQIIPHRISKYDAKECSRLQENLCVFFGPKSPSKIVELHQDFRFYITSQESRFVAHETNYDGARQLCLIKFAHSISALQMEMLGVIASHKQPVLYEEGLNLVEQDRILNQQINDLEQQTLFILVRGPDKGSILNDGLAIEKAQFLVKQVSNLREQQAELFITKQRLYDAHKSYFSVAQAAQSYYCAVSDLVNVETAYTFSLSWFINTILLASLHKEENKANNELMCSHLASTLYRRVGLTLLSKDKLLFALLLAVRPQLARGDASATEWRFLLSGQACPIDDDVSIHAVNYQRKTNIYTSSQHANPAKAWLPDKQWNEMCSLATLPAFLGLIEEFEAQIKMWKRVHDAPEPHAQPLPRHWDADLHGLSRLCILRCLRPDYIACAVRSFVRTELGNGFFENKKIAMSTIIDESLSQNPIVVTTTSQHKACAISFILGIAEGAGKEVSRVVVVPGHTHVADAFLTKIRSRATWALLDNLQLCPLYTRRLEDLCLNQSAYGATLNTKFRLWCVLDMRKKMSKSLLRGATKIIYEPLSGVRAVVSHLYSYSLDRNPDFLTLCTRGNEFRRIFFALCIFHALARERICYGPLLVQCLPVSTTSSPPPPPPIGLDGLSLIILMLQTCSYLQKYLVYCLIIMREARLQHRLLP